MIVQETIVLSIVVIMPNVQAKLKLRNMGCNNFVDDC